MGIDNCGHGCGMAKGDGQGGRLRGTAARDGCEDAVVWERKRWGGDEERNFDCR